MKILKTIIPIVLILGFGAWIFFTLSGNKEIIDADASRVEEVVTVIPVRVATVERVTIDNSIDLTGSFEARKQLDIIAEAQGRITSLTIAEGREISRGSIVAKIDDTSIRSQLSSAQATYQKAAKDVERYQRLVEAGAVSQLQYEDARLTMENAGTNVTAVEQQLKYTVVRSPMTGTVQELKVEEGSFATPGSAIATILDVSRLKMVVKVPETEIVKIRKGQKVAISTEVYPDHDFNGQVSLISVQADAGRKFEVEIELPYDSKYPLRAGMYGTVDIMAGGASETALFIPRRAIEGSLKNASVYVVEGDAARLRTVTTGRVIGENVEITNGLKEGERVVATGQINLEDGKSIRVLNEGPSAVKVSGTAETTLTER